MACTGEIAGCMQGGVQRLLDVIYVDEAQDFSPAELTSLMSLRGDSSGVTRRHMSDNQSRKSFSLQAIVFWDRRSFSFCRIELVLQCFRIDSILSNICIHVYTVEVDEVLGNKANVEIKNVQMT